MCSTRSATPAAMLKPSVIVVRSLVMASLAQRLRQAREAAGLQEGLFARMTGIAPERLEALERGAVPEPWELDEVARVFGVRIRDLDAPDGPRTWPLANVLFRAAQEGSTALEDLVDDGSYRMVGSFLRCVTEVADLERLLGRRPSPLPDISPALAQTSAHAPPWGADTLALALRRHVSLPPDRNIDSMISLLRELDVACFFTTPEELSPSIDAFSTRLPRPAILVNLIEGEQRWWRTRMTLAHELCHLLVDHSDALPATISPEQHQRHRYAYLEGLELQERRANAFAANFLAPEAGVRVCAADQDPRSEEAVACVAQRFGLGRSTAINRLTDVFELSELTRMRMVERSAQPWDGGEHPDEADVVIGLRNGVLRELTMQAYAQRAIDAVEARRLLGLDLSEPLPEWPGLDESDRAPIRTTEQQVLSAAGRFLAEHRSDHLVAVSPRRTDRGWTVDIEGARERRSLHLTFDLDVEPPSWLAA